MTPLEKADKELENFIRANPKLIPFQIKLSREMEQVPEDMRYLVILRHLINNLDELGVELELLKQTVEKHEKRR